MTAVSHVEIRLVIRRGDIFTSLQIRSKQNLWLIIGWLLYGFTNVIPNEELHNGSENSQVVLAPIRFFEMFAWSCHGVQGF